MGILSAILNVIRKVFSKIFRLIAKLVKEFWVVIAVVATLYFFGPAIGSWLAGVGAPAWVTGFFTGFPAWLSGIGSSLWGFAAGVGNKFMAAEIGTQAALLAGSALLLAPEETLAAVGEIGSLAGEVIGAAAGGVTSPFIPWVLAIAGIWFVLSRSDQSDPEKRDSRRPADA